MIKLTTKLMLMVHPCTVSIPLKKGWILIQSFFKGLEDQAGSNASVSLIIMLICHGILEDSSFPGHISMMIKLTTKLLLMVHPGTVSIQLQKAWTFIQSFVKGMEDDF